METINKLFVYGTLGPGRPNEHILKNIGGSWQKGSVTGFLYDKGWGAELGYPGIMLDEKGEKVEGFLFSFNSGSKPWLILDEFEGSEYRRVLTEIELQSGKIVNAFIYTLKQIIK